MNLKGTFLIISILTFVFFSCRKEEDIITDSSAKLTFSAESITFDTVFTTIGSVTKNIRVYNPHKETIKISSIRLNGGDQSNFRINVDGQAGNFHQNVEIASKDSMYIFIEVTVDPNNKSNPFVYEDKIEFFTNGNQQEVKLVAWGQNAHYFTPTSFNRNIPDYTCLTGPCSESLPPVNVTWVDDLPYVIYGFLVVDSLDQLNINPGVRVHFHNNAGLWVFRGGSLKVNGTLNQPVVFQGDRLEPEYQNIPGQWDRIWINEGGSNEINYAVIKNGFIGIHAEVLPFDNPPYDTTSLIIKNTLIDNCSGYGFLSAIYNAQLENTHITNCGQYNVAIQSAGNYDFRHCTFANYYAKASRETPAFFVQNSIVNARGTQIIGIPRINMFNSIVYGDRNVEFQHEIINNGTIDYVIQDCILKTDLSLADTISFKRIINNPPDQLFKDISGGNFELNEGSVARNKGSLNIGNTVPTDFLGNSRTADGMPDLGAYEYRP